MQNKKGNDWLLRFVKGMFIGTGAILPGVSGGALAAVFGLYERLIGFIANLRKDFKENLLYFLPVGFGGLFGVFLLSFVLSYFLEKAETQILWFFVGCIVGILPALYKQAAKNGRKPVHLVIMVVSAVVVLLLLNALPENGGGSGGVEAATQSFSLWMWVMAGGIFASGMIVPGLSPSNFLVFLNMYKPMTDAIKELDFFILIPMGVGALVTVIAFSKLVHFIFQKAYAGMFHFILGVVFASTVMIIPVRYDYRNLSTLVCAAALAAGVALGMWMSKLEEDYKPDED